MALLDIETFLMSHSRTLKFFALPEVTKEDKILIDRLCGRKTVEALIAEELQCDPVLLKTDVENNFGENNTCLNSKQREFCDHVLNKLRVGNQCCVF